MKKLSFLELSILTRYLIYFCIFLVQFNFLQKTLLFRILMYWLNVLAFKNYIICTLTQFCSFIFKRKVLYSRLFWRKRLLKPIILKNYELGTSLTLNCSSNQKLTQKSPNSKRFNNQINYDRIVIWLQKR